MQLAFDMTIEDTGKKLQMLPKPKHTNLSNTKTSVTASDFVEEIPLDNINGDLGSDVLALSVVSLSLAHLTSTSMETENAMSALE